MELPFPKSWNAATDKDKEEFKWLWINKAGDFVPMAKFINKHGGWRGGGEEVTASQIFEFIQTIPQSEKDGWEEIFKERVKATVREGARKGKATEVKLYAQSKISDYKKGNDEDDNRPTILLTAEELMSFKERMKNVQ